jgi:integrase
MITPNGSAGSTLLDAVRYAFGRSPSMSAWKDKARDHWRFKFVHLGKTITGRGYVTRREAIAAREKMRKEVRNAAASLKQIHPVMGFRELASGYLDYSERKHAKRTYQYKKLTFKRFLHEKGDLPVETITPSDIHEFLNTLPTNRVYNAARKELSALFEYAIHKLKLVGIATNPCADIDIMPHSPRPKRIPSEDEIVKIILASAPGDEQDIIMCCLHTLGRIDEVLRMKWEDVNFEKQSVTLWTRKRKDGAYEPDALPMNEDLKQILNTRWNTKKQGIWVFYNEKTNDRYHHRPKMMASICKRAGLEPIGKSKRRINKGPKKGKYKEISLYYGFHALRHFMASYLADQGKTGMKVISGLLRHKNLKTTEIYLHSIDESQRAAVTQIEGRFTPKNTKSLPKVAPTKIKEVTESL